MFIDDDVFGLQAHTGLPLRYRLKLLRYAWRHQFWLKEASSELWVSTPWLAEKYAGWSPLVLAPRSPYEHTLPQKTLFYHGSASHGPEFEWLYPILRQVLEQDDSLSLEVIGDRRLRQQFTDLPRVHVLHPMSWPAYQALLARPGAPLALLHCLQTALMPPVHPLNF
ncbi:hypothetical protein MBH78_21280 [Oceanimonas sp. NS1]|nr:hypothetical protein [Oceanimonas sp. NS1]